MEPRFQRRDQRVVRLRQIHSNGGQRKVLREYRSVTLVLRIAMTRHHHAHHRARRGQLREAGDHGRIDAARKTDQESLCTGGGNRLAHPAGKTFDQPHVFS